MPAIPARLLREAAALKPRTSIVEGGLELNDMPNLLSHASNAADSLPAPGAHYLIPFAARSRFLFKMDFAEAEYIARLRSGVKGHFSYRNIAWAVEAKNECPGTRTGTPHGRYAALDGRSVDKDSM